MSLMIGKVILLMCSVMVVIVLLSIVVSLELM